MRTALCLFGKVGGIEGKDGAGERTDYALCYAHYKKHIIDPNNADVFMHCWDVDLQSQLRGLYEPKASIFEPQIAFKQDESNRLISRWYSTRVSVGLRRDWETHQNAPESPTSDDPEDPINRTQEPQTAPQAATGAQKQYDWVMLGRFDLMWLVDFRFETLEPGYFYAAHWNAPRRYRQIGGEKVVIPPDRENRSLTRNELADLWFVADSQTMDKFADCFNNLAEFGASGHSAAWQQVEKVLGDPHKVVRYKFYRWWDFELYRWKVCGQYS